MTVSPYVSYDSLPIVASGNSAKDGGQAAGAEQLKETAYYSTTLHFRIPSSYLSGKAVHMIGLYPNNAISDQADVLAYYLLTDEKTKEWKPIDLSSITSTFSLIVD